VGDGEYHYVKIVTKKLQKPKRNFVQDVKKFLKTEKLAYLAEIKAI